jgi:hypothetical protein
MVNISPSLKIRFLKSYEGAARLANDRKAAKHIEKIKQAYETLSTKNQKGFAM